MKYIFLHGGPGLKDYLSTYFSKHFQNDGVFFQLNDDQKSVDKVVDFVEKQIQNTNSDVTLVGHSWGGIVAMEYFARKKDISKIKKLILMCSPISVKSEQFHQERLQSLGINPSDLPSIFATPEELANYAADVQTIFSGLDPEVLGYYIENQMSNYDFTETLKSIEIPIHNIIAEKDNRVTKEYLETYPQINSSIYNHIIKDCGHFPFLNPEVAQNISSMIREDVEC